MLILRTLNQIKLQSHPILSGRTNTSLNWNLKESCDLKKNPNMYPKHTSHSNLAAEIHSIMGNRQSLIGYYLNCVFLAGYVQIRVNDCGNTSRHQVPACHYNLLTESDRWQADHSTGFSFSGGKGKKKKKSDGRSKCIRCGFVTMHMNSEVKGQCSATVGVRAIQRRRRAYGAETDPRGNPSILGHY